MRQQEASSSTGVDRQARARLEAQARNYSDVEKAFFNGRCQKADTCLIIAIDHLNGRSYEELSKAELLAFCDHYDHVHDFREYYDDWFWGYTPDALIGVIPPSPSLIRADIFDPANPHPALKALSLASAHLKGQRINPKSPIGSFLELPPATVEAFTKAFAPFLPQPSLPAEVVEIFPRTAPTSSPTIPPPETTDREPGMAAEGELILMQNGVSYRPLLVAAQRVQASRRTVHEWVKNKTKFAGRELKTVERSNSCFIADESIERMANRFVKWHKGKPAGPAGAVTIGATEDRSGYLSTIEAARVLGVSSRTPWVWANEDGKAPTGKQLDVVKCTTSKRYYIHERDVYEIKNQLPKTGLSRGRRPTKTLTPK
jgi:predicted DNA-binding protein (UPF0251 family)